MGAFDLKEAQLRDFIDSLTPAAMAALVLEVERDRMHGGNNFPHDAILDYLRSALHLAKQRPPRVKSPLRYFCDPFEDMLVDETTPEKQHGRILRSSIKPVWNWLREDLAHDEMTALEDKLIDAIVADNNERIGKLLQPMYKLGGDVISKALGALEPNTRPYLRVAARLGGPHALEDARDMALAHRAAAPRRALISRLPWSMAMSDADSENYIKRVKEICAGDGDALSVALLSMMPRLHSRSEIMQILASLIGSDRDAKMRESPGAVVGECVLHDMSLCARRTTELIAIRAGVESVLTALSSFHLLAEGFDNAVDIDVKSPWGKRLIEIRKELSFVVGNEIAATPRLIKKALFQRKRDRAGAQAGPGTLALPNAEDLAEAQFALQLLQGIRPYLGHLSINAEFAKTRREVDQFLEAIGEYVVEEVRSAQGEARECADTYLEATVDLTGIFFGREAAELLRRRGRAAARREHDETAATA